MKRELVSSVLLLAVVLVMSLPAEILAEQPAGDNDWQAVEPGQNEWEAVGTGENEWQAAGNGDQPWVTGDPDAAPVGVQQPRHRRMPRFFLSTSLFFVPEPTLVQKRGDRRCGARLDEQTGMAIDFDFRFWYLFVGAHLGIGGNDGVEITEYALRGGAIIPLSERFSIVGSAWMGPVRWETTADFPRTLSVTTDYRSPLVDEFSRDKEGFQFGASLGIRFMIASWFGLSSELALSTTLFDDESYGYEPSGDGYQMNRVQVMSGVLFAW